LDGLFAKLPVADSGRTQESHEVCDDIIRLLRSSSHRIHERMKEIADYVALSRTPRAFAPCRVVKVAESVAKALQVLAERNGIALRLDGLDAVPPILADENRLYSALYNLVHNAIPEVPAGGSITVRGAHDAANGCVELAVQDTGVGMPPEIRDSLFTNRVVSRKTGGTGLGTKIVKDVVDAHGGSIAVESEVGRGTTFCIRLPMQPPSCSSDSSAPVQSGLAVTAKL
jgi:signal transduction histidine kinase